MKMFFFSEEFSNTIVLPMVALFLGTGNYTPEVPAIILERLCTSPTYGMWYPPDKHSVASNMPPMVVFPRFSTFYETWKEKLVEQGVKVRLLTQVTKVVKRDQSGVTVRVAKRTAAANARNEYTAYVPMGAPDLGDVDVDADADAREVEEHYDEIVLCVLYVGSEISPTPWIQNTADLLPAPTRRK